MLSLFPDLLTFGLLVPFLLRVVIGIIWFCYGFDLLKSRRRQAQAELAQTFGMLGTFGVFLGGLTMSVVGLMLIAGLYTQGVAIVAALAALKLLFLRRRFPSIAPYERLVYVLLFTIAISLLFLGAGAFAFDLPL